MCVPQSKLGVVWPPPEAESTSNPFSMCNLDLGGDGGQDEGGGGSTEMVSLREQERKKSGKRTKKQQKALRDGAASTCKGIHKYMTQYVGSDGSFYLEAGKTEKHHDFFWGDNLKTFLVKHNPLLPKEAR